MSIVWKLLRRLKGSSVPSKPLPPPVQSKPVIPLPETVPEARLPKGKLLEEDLPMGKLLEEKVPDERLPMTRLEKVKRYGPGVAVTGLTLALLGKEVYDSFIKPREKPLYEPEGLKPETRRSIKESFEQSIREMGEPEPSPTQKIQQASDRIIEEMKSYIDAARNRMFETPPQPKPPPNRGAMYRLREGMTPTVEDTALASLLYGPPYGDIT